MSRSQVCDLIPLGKTLHFFIPMFIMIFCLHKGMNFKNIFIGIFILGISKEIYDLTTIDSNILDSCRDMALDMAYPTLVLLVKIIKTFHLAPVFKRP